MKPEELQTACEDAWARMYDNKTLQRKLIRTLKASKNAISATWAYTSNLQYHNLTFEHERDRVDIRDVLNQFSEPVKK
jgi:hypothetical protein